jgi:hypothetical protein
MTARKALFCRQADGVCGCGLLPSGTINEVENSKPRSYSGKP